LVGHEDGPLDFRLVHQRSAGGLAISSA
jgi:hypothetical protein